MKNNPISTPFRFFIRSLLINSLLILLPLLLVGLFSIFRTTKESALEAQKRASRILSQADDILETFYSHVDNAYLFFASNPRVTLQLKNAFAEPYLSLNSMKSVENISLSFQNLIYTDDCLQNIYIYYKNDFNRIFIPVSSRLIAFPPEKEEKIQTSYHHAGTEDVWMEFSEDPLLYTEYPIPSLMIYRKLYHRTTDVQNGLAIFSFNADRMKSKLDQLLEYEDQKIFLIDSGSHIVWPSSDEFSEETLLSLSEQLASGYKQKSSETASQDYGAYTAAYLRSPRSYGFTYLLMTPKSKIYESTISLASMYIFITLAAIAIACMFAFFKTRHDYKYLNKIIGVFSMPDSSLEKIPPSEKRISNPFEYILLNIIRLFMEQDYLKIQDSEKTAKLQLSEMRALQHQINPHFLHNTLNGIYWESVKLTGSENRCSQMISHLSAIMRYCLGTPQENVTVQNEIDYLKKYLEIMKLRYVDKFDAEFLVSSDCLAFHVKKMLLQPLAENAIYHGIKEKKGKGLIRISVHRKKNRIYFNIYDTGNGIPPQRFAAMKRDLSQSSSSSGRNIGLVNTNSRLILSYGIDSELHMNSRQGKFTVFWFSIPVSEEA